MARAAFLRYGKGRYPAGLNFGDCLTWPSLRPQCARTADRRVGGNHVAWNGQRFDSSSALLP